ncbi:FecR family protein [Chitinimonas naiadis]
MASLLSWHGATLVLLLAFLAEPGRAETLQATVKRVGASAWLDLDGKLTPLKSGAHLAEGSVLLTDSKGRIQLQLPDGSTLYIGGDSRLRIDELQQAEGAGSALVRQGFALGKGALRFVTGTLAKLKPREVTVKLQTSTIGVRGTDFFAEQDGEEENVCLFEGRVAVEDSRGPTYVLDQPRQFFHIERAADAQATISTANAKQVGNWLRKTMPAGRH